MPVTEKEQCFQAMRLIEKGDWNGAHDIVDSIHSKDASLIHAYLHRIEGDDWNADYWYRQAGRQRPNVSIEDEWQLIMDLIK